jgi:hypothetical protein
MNMEWRQSLQVWWSIFWRGGVFGIGFGFLLGALGGLSAALSGVPQTAAQYGQVGGLIASIPASVLAVKQALGKHLPSLAALFGRSKA